jgi:hypothetical protein
MIAAHFARLQDIEPTPRSDPIAFLLLHRIEYTDAHPWVAVVGLVATGVIGGLLNGWLR